MEFLYLVLIGVIIYLICKRDDEKAEELSKLFDAKLDFYILKNKKKTTTQLIKQLEEKTPIYIQRRDIVVNNYNANNPNNKIEFEPLNLDDSINYIEFDSQADSLIARKYGVEFIAEYRAIALLVEERIGNQSESAT